MHNPLWEFSLQLYARPGVAEACIEAQDHYAADVNLLLYAAWLAQQGLELDPGQWQALAAGVDEWRRRVVAPLRALRRDWKALPDAAALREQVRALELAAEQAQQEQILAWHRRQAPRPAQAGSLLWALACLLGSPPAQAGSEAPELGRRLLALLG
ncbi:MAG: TIGR02444 family protein [Haliea sp.]|uniref:TIGR02444 family protein n=1 Tax=Haliea sp. TaxID=1932666 RepID=UPI0032EF3E55